MRKWLWGREWGLDCLTKPGRSHWLFLLEGSDNVRGIFNMVTVEYWPTGWSCCGMSDVAFRNDVLGCLRCLDSLIDAVILCKGRTGLTSTCELSWISSALHLHAPVCQLFDTLQSINTLFKHVASKSLVSSIKIRTCMQQKNPRYSSRKFFSTSHMFISTTFTRYYSSSTL